jgi:hypothetical protein
LPTRPFDATRFLTPSPHQNRCRRPRVEKVGLTSALVEAERVADAKLRARLKVDAQLKLATTLVIHEGPQSSEAESALEKTRTLAEEANARPQLFQATWGLLGTAVRIASEQGAVVFI